MHNGVHYINNVSMWPHWGTDASTSASKGSFSLISFILLPIDLVTRATRVCIKKPGKHGGYVCHCMYMY